MSATPAICTDSTSVLYWVIFNSGLGEDAIGRLTMEWQSHSPGIDDKLWAIFTELNGD